ncbi:hypothetical protein WK32_18665 [Burkholderia vietnamiensis]|uniref:Uncharacterized protein n=1 Tax=Burkholderia vietnamiensis TaxID=60552 RepID=A0AA44Y352_BURVI|nr:hypothetical protein WK32_18665 [Burkholderia vietnamiensis]PRH41147.1 hypothetical protein C6T65_17240 [Burkholderia vietnamiensis]
MHARNAGTTRGPTASAAANVARRTRGALRTAARGPAGGPFEWRPIMPPSATCAPFVRAARGRGRLRCAADLSGGFHARRDRTFQC